MTCTKCKFFAYKYKFAEKSTILIYSLFSVTNFVFQAQGCIAAQRPLGLQSLKCLFTGLFTGEKNVVSTSVLNRLCRSSGSGILAFVTFICWELFFKRNLHADGFCPCTEYILLEI